MAPLPLSGDSAEGDVAVGDEGAGRDLTGDEGIDLEAGAPELAAVAIDGVHPAEAVGGVDAVPDDRRCAGDRAPGREAPVHPQPAYGARTQHAFSGVVAGPSGVVVVRRPVVGVPGNVVESAGDQAVLQGFELGADRVLGGRRPASGRVFGEQKGKHGWKLLRRCGLRCPGSVRSSARRPGAGPVMGLLDGYQSEW
jgi:hypothetical protein